MHWFQISNTAVAMADIYVGTLALCLASAFLFLLKRIPLRYIFVHQGLLALPMMVAIGCLGFITQSTTTSVWHLSRLGWLIALFVNLIGIIVQRFSAHYLYGDRKYRQYFFLFTVTTAMNSLTWLMNDTRWMAMCWGASLLGMLLLFRLNQFSSGTKSMTKQAAAMFVASWLAFALTVTLIWQATGSWNLSMAQSAVGLSRITPGMHLVIDLLLVLVAVIPAAQWPFGRWLIHSAAVPTPVSAVMHGGFVNIGGIMLTVFAPLFTSTLARETLFVIAAVSIFLGIGIMRVHVDYKRQLVASTISQMGFMLVQCALGAYVAAVLHLMLHGFFKSSLFLQSGGAVVRQRPVKSASPVSGTWTKWGLAVIVGTATAAIYWGTSPTLGYRVLSAVMLGFAAGMGWIQLVGSRPVRTKVVMGVSTFVLSVIIYKVVHAVLAPWIANGPAQTASLPTGLLVLAGLWIVLSGLGFYLLHPLRREATPLSSRLYLWLVHLGEPNYRMVELHPRSGGVRGQISM